jgi:hypothetical protein
MLYMPQNDKVEHSVAKVRFGPVLSHFSENLEPNLHPSGQDRTGSGFKITKKCDILFSKSI